MYELPEPGDGDQSGGDQNGHMECQMERPTDDYAPTEIDPMIATPPEFIMSTPRRLLSPDNQLGLSTSGSKTKMSEVRDDIPEVKDDIPEVRMNDIPEFRDDIPKVIDPEVRDDTQQHLVTD